MIKTMTGEITLGRNTQRALMIALFSFLTFAASLIRIQTPISPVPFTMQTFVVFIAAYYLSAKDNGISQLSYILAGMIGAPVFAAGLTGALALVGPTAGYLAGFVIAGSLMSFMISKAGKLTYAKAALIFTAGSTVILALGTLHIALVYKIGFVKAFAAGFAPFIAAEAIKISAAAILFGNRK